MANEPLAYMFVFWDDLWSLNGNRSSEKQPDPTGRRIRLFCVCFWKSRRGRNRSGAQDVQPLCNIMLKIVDKWLNCNYNLIGNIFWYRLIWANHIILRQSIRRIRQVNPALEWYGKFIFTCKADRSVVISNQIWHCNPDLMKHYLKKRRIPWC